MARLEIRVAAVVFLLALSRFRCDEEEISRKTYIVRMDKGAMPAIFRTHESWYESTLAAASGIHAAAPAAEFIHIYNTAMHGFAAKMSARQAAALESAPGFIHMFPDSAKKLHTTYSPQFLHLEQSNHAPSLLWKDSTYGSEAIVGIFDTGVWPQSQSFDDRKMSPVPSRWKGTCQAGPGFDPKLCNRKLIGARFFYRGYEAMSGPINDTTEFKSPRDSDGHGTHTASTAAGRDVYRADLLGFAAGTARGMAPKARIAAYKVCWQSGCFDSDILAAFDRAVSDGVDVISLSVGGGVMPYYLDSIAIGSFAAMERGIFVACSGGNEGPTDMSVTNIAPWITTVGASTMDRSFPANVKLGNGMSAHPTWSPAAIRSALMTTSTMEGKSGHVIGDEATSNSSTPFDFGSGLVDPVSALDPGLVYDLSVRDYERFLCGLNYSSRARSTVTRSHFSCSKDSTTRDRPSSLNYPSFSVVFDLSQKAYTTTVSRTVTNVGPAKSLYTARVVAPRGVEITVKPSKLEFQKRNQKMEFQMSITAKSSRSVAAGESETQFGVLIWSNTRGGRQMVQSPIAISRQQPF
ncbi:hypothetical protein SELMODRAFT_416154 [Selaginella moellendorffii]|uniref:Subtilisin-like protease fibronectin type-III domain-containing protein n=1 Tax=Selaginella moellendorffii TaxID=88036 RepID=D8RY94_SELML|nr:hypothetical protein SELMODRAFT_416154 [Selaginella moellendorffii]